jgi:hypothetical protein
MVTVILQFKPPYDTDHETGLALLAQTALDLFGTGGNPTAAQVEEFLGWVNTPVSNGYVRVLIDDYAANALEAMGDNSVGTLIRVERMGQDKVAVEKPVLDEDGNDTGETETVEETQLFQVGTQDVTDEQGNPTGETRPLFLGRMA